MYRAAGRAEVVLFTTLDTRLCSWLAIAAAVAAASIAAAQHEAGADSRLGKDGSCFANLHIMTQ